MVYSIRKFLIPSLMSLIIANTHVWAGSMNLTGNVETDFPTGAQGVNVILDYNGSTGDVAQPQWMTDQGKINGWNVKDVRLAYDSSTDTMYVGMNYFGVYGDVDGNGVRGTSTDQFKQAGGLELGEVGGRSSITLAFGPNQPGAVPTVVAGISGDKTQVGPGLYGFNVANAIPGANLGMNYGANLPNNQGVLINTGPDFEFTINNFSTLPGINMNSGIGLTFYSGSPDDMLIGEDTMPYYTIGQISPIIIPEPTTILAWTLGIAAIGLHARRKSKISQ
jgi:hypothetical protein